MTFAAELPGGLVHTPAQKCDVDQIDTLWNKFAYMPPDCRWWVSLVDEADQMTDKAQLQLLSKMDGTAALRPLWGGDQERGEAPPIIWIFTSNGVGPDGIIPPAALLPRFLDRCTIKLAFKLPDQGEIAGYLQKVWKREGGRVGLPREYFEHLAEGVSIREGLNRLDSELLRNPTIKEARAVLAEKASRIAERENAAATEWEESSELDKDPEVAAAIESLQEAINANASRQTIAAKRAWVTMKRDAARKQIA